MTLPSHLQAEEALLGAMLLSSHAIHDAVAHVSADEFISEQNRAVFEAITALWLSGEPADPLTVSEYLGRRGITLTVGDLNKSAHRTPNVFSAAKYARIIADHATMRRLMFLGDNLRLQAQALPDDPYALAERTIAELQSIGSPVQQVESGPDLDAFLAQVDGEADMIVPGFLERTDRVVLTGSEGRGKVRPSVKEGSRWPRGSCRSPSPQRARRAASCSSTARTPQGNYGGNSHHCGHARVIDSTRRGSS